MPLEPVRPTVTPRPGTAARTSSAEVLGSLPAHNARTAPPPEPRRHVALRAEALGRVQLGERLAGVDGEALQVRQRVAVADEADVERAA